MTTVAGTHTLITFSTGATLQINNILPGQLQSTDFELPTSAEPQTGKSEVSETGGVDPDAAFAGFDFSSLGAGGAQDAIESHAFAGFGPGAVHPAHDLHAGMAPDALNLLEDVFVFDLNPGHDWQGA